MAAPFPAFPADDPKILSGGAWLAVTTMLADLAFETDAAGRFTAFGPGLVFGQPGAALLGRPLATLLAPPYRPALVAQLAAVFAAISAECVAWQGTVSIIRADGIAAAHRLALAPRITAGRATGAYGMIFEVDLPVPYLGDTGAPEDATALAWRLDPETGFWTARIFDEELSRRFDRLDVEEHPGTLIYLGLGTAAPGAAIAIATELREVVRPTDLLGRIDETTIALWCDGMDHLTGAERAAKFCQRLPAVLPGRMPVTAGVAARWPGTADDAGTIMERAAAALRLAELATGRKLEDAPRTGAWRVWQSG